MKKMKKVLLSATMALSIGVVGLMTAPEAEAGPIKPEPWSVEKKNAVSTMAIPPDPW